MTRRDPGLLEIYPETLIEINPDDACRLGIDNGDTIVIQSRRGEMSGRALLTQRVSAGLVYGNFHFPGENNVNNLTIAALDPFSKIPEYKVCAVRILSAAQIKELQS